MATKYTFICDVCGKRFESSTGNIIKLCLNKEPYEMDFCTDCIKKEIVSMMDESKSNLNRVPFVKLGPIFESVEEARYRARVKE